MSRPTPLKAWLCGLLAAGATLVGAATDNLRLAYGVTREGTVLQSDVHPSLLEADSPLTRVLVIARAETQPEAARATAALMGKIAAVSSLWSTRFPGVSVSAIAAPHPDGRATTATFPPTGRAYDDPIHPEAIHLWRWVGMLGPDVVVELRAGDTVAWTLPRTAAADRAETNFADALVPLTEEPAAGSLPAALANHAACDVARIPALSLRAATEADLEPLLHALQRRAVRSPARRELLRRENRSPLEVAHELSRTYGQRLDEVAYIPALSLIARLRLGELTDDASHLRDVRRIAQPCLAGEKPALPAKSNGSQQAGHLLFGELAAIAPDARALALLRAAAELGFDAHGRPLAAMPAHAEMSDAVFLGAPLLAQTARLTGEAKYRDLALRHLRFMAALNQRPDGLHRHSPAAPDQTAWGRGNGFVALGLALALSELPEDGAEFREVLTLYRNHLDAMRPHQDALGMWRQVVDRPESYREFTVTCMTTLAIARGLRRGWLDRAAFEPAVRRAWRSIKHRTAPDGGLVDVCAGTGKMKSLREYLDRPALLGRDDRGGAMVFLLSTELARAERDAKLTLR